MQNTKVYQKEELELYRLMATKSVHLSKDGTPKIDNLGNTLVMYCYR